MGLTRRARRHKKLERLAADWDALEKSLEECGGRSGDPFEWLDQEISATRRECAAAGCKQCAFI